MAITNDKSRDGKMIMAESLVSNRTHEGMVQLRYEDEEQPFLQATAEEARTLAMRLIEAAEAGETDAFLVEFFQKRLNVPFERAAVILRDFRSFREARNPEKQQ